MSKSKKSPTPKQPATVIHKNGGLREFAGPSTFRGTGTFSSNGFKSKDVS